MYKVGINSSLASCSALVFVSHATGARLFDRDDLLAQFLSRYIPAVRNDMRRTGCSVFRSYLVNASNVALLPPFERQFTVCVRELIESE